MAQAVVAGMAASVAGETKTADPYSQHRISSWMAGGSAIIRGWVARSRQRQALGALDDRLLRDIGVSRQQALGEAAKWFWRP
jgi:uncharacterized protein YjiS (DUF1127 family)